MILWKFKLAKSHEYLLLKLISSFAMMHKDLPWHNHYKFLFTVFLRNI